MRATKFTAITAATLFAFSVAACGGSDDSSTDTAAAPPAAVPTSPAPSPSSTADMTTASFGTACSAVPTDPTNKGSFEAMAKVPVATAASGNPLLSTLVSAVTKAKLGDSLNTAPELTVFAPTNDAFKKIPKATLDKVLADNKTLTKILTYHVVAGKIMPADLDGTHKTLEGQDLTVKGSGSAYEVNGTSQVICGNVQTANAIVYIVDTVLMPKS